jgi:hypothetical protein
MQYELQPTRKYQLILEQNVDPGQQAYLAAYCKSTKYNGRWTDCDDGMDHQGSSTVLNNDGITYMVVYTS